MPLSPQAPALPKLNWNKFIPDIILLLLYFFCLDPLIHWQQSNLVLSCHILMLLNIVAIGLGCYTFFTAFADMDLLIKYRDSISKFESAALGLSAFISCLAFLWWLVPFAAVKKMGVNETGFIWGALLYFITFMAVVASSINNKKGMMLAGSIVLKTLNNAASISFFFLVILFC